MKNRFKSFKKAISVMLAAFTVISLLPASVFKAAAYYSSYEIYCEVPGGTSALTYLDSYSSADVWINGGKATYITGTVSETKSIQLMLYEKIYDSSKGSNTYYNITSLKGIEWYVGDSPASASQSSGKFQNKNDYISVSKGKVTAGKTPGTSYVFAYRSSGDKNIPSTMLTCAKINVKFAPQKMLVYDKVASAPDTAIVKDVSLGLGESKWIYPAPDLKAKNIDPNLLETSELTYNVSVEKGSQCVSLSTSYQFTDPGATLNDISANELALGIRITANSIIPDTKVESPTSDDRQDKSAKVNVIITNNQSGKSVKIPVNINNTVLDFFVPDDVINVYTSSTKVADPVLVSLNPLLSGLLLYPQYAGSSTVKPLIGIYTTDQSENFAAFTDSKGKLKLPTANKSSDVSVSVKNKANTKLELKFKKANYTTPKTVYIVVAYGTDPEKQIKQFSLVLFTPPPPNTETTF